MTVIDSVWRFTAIADLMVLLACGTAIHLAYRDAMPKLAWRAGWGYGAVLGITVAAVAVNATLGEPLTPGLKVGTVGMTLAAVFVGALFGVEVRRGWLALRDERRGRIIARADEVAAWAAHVEHAEPCTNPECQRMRAELLRITGPSTPTP